MNLIPGTYSLEVDQPGFKRTLRPSILVEVGAALRIDVTLQVGDSTQSVEVSAASPLIQTETATLSQVVGARTVEEIPLNGRNVLNLVALVPGVVPQGNALTNLQAQNIFAAGNFQIGGGAANQSSTLLDGSPLNVNYANLTALVPTQDAVAEFRVQTNNNTAEYGRYTGGVINLTSKSGTNEFHGALYEYLRNRVLNAGTFFGNQTGAGKPAFTQNQFGGNFGGPIQKDRTFFFLGYEGFREVQGSNLLNSVPTAQVLNGDFSNYRNAAGAVIPIYDPASTNCPNPANLATCTRTPFAGNIIPVTRFDPVANILRTNLFAPPNLPGNPYTNQFNYSTNVPIGGQNDQLNARLDRTISDKQRLFARFTRWTLDDLPPEGYGKNIPYLAGSAQPEIFTTDSTVLADTYVLSPATVLDVRGAFLRFFYNRSPKVEAGSISETSFGMPSYFNQVPLSDWPGISLTEYNAGSAGGRIRSANNSYSLAPTLTRIAGRHTLKFGMELRKMQFNFLQDISPGGSYTFSNLFTSQNALSPGATGSSFASFLLGDVASGQVSLVNFTASTMNYQGYYANDTWQASSKLTLTLGLRWEVPGVWTERHNDISVFEQNAVNPLAQQTGLPLKGAFALVNTPQDPVRGQMPEYWKAFAPRIGVAYRLGQKTVLRAGGGLFYIPADSNFVESPYQNAVNYYANTMVGTTNNSVTPYNVLSNPFPNGFVPAPGRSANFQSLLEGGNFSSTSSGTASVVLPNHRTPVVSQWNAAIERQFGTTAVEAGYSGSRGVHLPDGGMQLNQIPDQYLSMGNALLTQVPNPFLGLIAAGPLAQPTIQAGQLLRPYPEYLTVADAGGYIGNSTYEALQAKVEKRFQKGGTILAAYTFSKMLTDVETLTTWLESAGTGGSSAGYQDFNNMRLEKALSAFDTRQRLVVSYVVDLPVGHGQKILGGVRGPADKFLSGWGINGVTTLQQGYPLHMTATPASIPVANGGGNLRPNVISGCNPVLGGPIQSRLTHYFNTACYTFPTPFTFGDEPRTDPVVRGPGINNFDFALFKRTPITERMSLEFRAEVFNVFNRVQFGQPTTAETTAANSTFGVITTQANNPRLIQLALRLRF